MSRHHVYIALRHRSCHHHPPAPPTAAWALRLSVTTGKLLGRTAARGRGCFQEQMEAPGHRAGTPLLRSVAIAQRSVQVNAPARVLGLQKNPPIARHALSSVMSCTLTFPAVVPAPISVYWCARLKIACSNEQGSLFGGATWAICCAGEGRSTEFGISF